MTEAVNEVSLGAEKEGVVVVGGGHMHRVCAVFRFYCEARIHLNVLRHGLLY